MKEMIIDDVDFYNVSIYKASKENDVFGFRFLDYGNFLIVDLKSEEVVQISNFVESDFEHHSDDTIIDIPSKPFYSYTDDEKRMYESVINALYIDLEEVSKYDYNWSNATIYVMHFELYESLIMIFLCLNDGEVLSTSYFYENKDGEILIDSLNGYDSFSELSLSEDELQFLDRVKSDALSVIEYNTGQTFKVIKSRIDE
jgi:hypothetical protein